MEFVIKTDGCRGEDQVMHLEHVQAVITMSARKRGDISLALVSPMGKCCYTVEHVVLTVVGNCFVSVTVTTCSFKYNLCVYQIMADKATLMPLSLPFTPF